MRLRRFSGKTEAEALALVRLELGPGAIILDTKRTTSDIRGMFGADTVEVLAAPGESPDTPPVTVTGQKKKPDSPAPTVALELLAEGVDPALVFGMSAPAEAESAERGLERVVNDLMSKNAAEPAFGRGDRVAFVGPTGSGKTTTAAKLCALASLTYGLSAAWLTADVYRAGGVEQATIYADIMRVPLEVCTSPETTREARMLHKTADYVLLDTGGMSHLASEDLERLRKTVTAFEPTTVYLTLPASSSWQHACEILSGFSTVGYDRLIVTKLDEASRTGVILNIAGLTDKKMDFFTTGQMVPDDICVAGPDPVLEKIRKRRAGTEHTTLGSSTPTRVKGGRGLERGETVGRL